MLSVAVRGQNAGPTSVPARNVPDGDSNSRTEHSVAQQKLACAERAMKLLEPDSKPGVEANLADVALWSSRLLNAELDLAANRDDKLAAMRKYCEHIKILEADADRRSNRGLISPLQRESLMYQRLEVEQRIAADR
jgi:hypothetical protein